MKVTVANSLVAYRNVISATLKKLRPHLEVSTADPEDLDDEFRRLWPQLVVCTRVTGLVESKALAWVELYPDHASSEVVVSLAGERTTYPDLDFEALLSVVDETERLYETTRHQPGARSL